MFCGKCGNQLSNDAAFCGVCGNAVNTPAKTPVAPDAPKPAQPDSAPKAINDFIKIPAVSELVVIGVAALMFIFMFLPWFKIELFGHFSIFTGMLYMFKISAFLGLAKVFGIINIFVFIIYAALHFVDVRKFISTIPETVDLKKYSAYAFGGIYAFMCLLTIIGAIANSYVGISVCLIFSIIFVAAFAVATFKAELVDKLLKDVFKIKKD